MLPAIFENQVTKSLGNSIYGPGGDGGGRSAYDISFGEFLLNGGQLDLVSNEAIRLYLRCLPFAQAVDMRAKAFANLKLKIFDKKENDFPKDQSHPVLELLAQPNTDQTGEEFLTAFSAFSDITGNSFLNVTSMGESAPPLEIFNVQPTDVTILPSTGFGTSGFAGQFLVNDDHTGQSVYELDDSGVRFRYFTSDGDSEFWQVRSFNPLRGGNRLFGTSPAQPIWLEIQQYIEGNQTNFSSLVNGVRPSGAFSNKKEKPLTDKQWTRLQEMAAQYTGSKGAGKAFIADGVDFTPIQITNREQEYSILQQSMFEKIFLRYDIPIPLISSSVATYNNLATAMFHFYDGGVSPHANKLLRELTVFLMHRYPGSENLELRFDRAEVDALRLRAFEEGKEMRAIGVSSDNEIRTVLGYESTGTDGDVIYKPSTLQPAGIDTDTSGNDASPPNRSKFMGVMMQTKNPATGKNYTMSEAFEAGQEVGIWNGGG